MVILYSYDDLIYDLVKQDPAWPPHYDSDSILEMCISIIYSPRGPTGTWYGPYEMDSLEMLNIELNSCYPFWLVEGNWRTRKTTSALSFNSE